MKCELQCRAKPEARRWDNNKERNRWYCCRRRSMLRKVVLAELKKRLFENENRLNCRLFLFMNDRVSRCWLRKCRECKHESKNKIETNVDDLVDHALDVSRLFDKSYLNCSADRMIKKISQIVHLFLSEARNHLSLDRRDVAIAKHAEKSEIDVVKHSRWSSERLSIMSLLLNMLSLIRRL